jgi:bacterioferritin
MTITDLIPLLNKDLALEYQAVQQYVQHYGIMTGPEYMVIREAMREHSEDELKHANMLSDLIQYYGGTPVGSGPSPSEATESKKAITLDLASENIAIGRYRTRVKQSEDMGYYELGSALRSILTDELDHANELALALGK